MANISEDSNPLNVSPRAIIRESPQIALTQASTQALKPQPEELKHHHSSHANIQNQNNHSSQNDNTAEQCRALSALAANLDLQGNEKIPIGPSLADPSLVPELVPKGKMELQRDAPSGSIAKDGQSTQLSLARAGQLTGTGKSIIVLPRSAPNAPSRCNNMEQSLSGLDKRSRSNFASSIERTISKRKSSGKCATARPTSAAEKQGTKKSSAKSNQSGNCGNYNPKSKTSIVCRNVKSFNKQPKTGAKQSTITTAISSTTSTTTTSTASTSKKPTSKSPPANKNSKSSSSVKSKSSMLSTISRIKTKSKSRNQAHRNGSHKKKTAKYQKPKRCNNK